MKPRSEPPDSEQELTDRCGAIAGKTLQHLATEYGWLMPETPSQGKGWTGQLIEFILGTNAGCQAEADFVDLGIELKTLPLNTRLMPAESTYVTNIPLRTIQNQTWETSTCWQKLKRVLWFPIEGDHTIPFAERRVGMGFIWSPTPIQQAGLRQDWQEHVDKIVCGHLESIDASQGQYLQIRPKAANARTLTDGFDQDGNRTQTLPRGFYLRPGFTGIVLSQEPGFTSE